MKRLLFSICLLCCMSAFAGSYHLSDLECHNIPVDKVEDSFSDWFNYPSGTTFLKTRDVVDDIGMRHVDYKQYYNGVEIKNHLIMVHSKGGIVTSVEAKVMETSTSTARKKNSTAGDVYIIAVDTEDGQEYKQAYKKITKDFQFEEYYDVNTGELIKKISLVNNADVYGVGQTVYLDKQVIMCDDAEYATKGYYRLVDNKRMIQTVDASVFDSIKFEKEKSLWISQHPVSTVEEQIEALRNMFLGLCQNFYNPTVYFYAGTYLSEVKISSISGNWWGSTDTPDLYVRVCNEKGTALYKTKYIADTYPPVTFTLPDQLLPIKKTGYTIDILDDDSPLSDDYGETVKISKLEPATYSWTGTKTSGSFKLSPYPHGACDAHWGMEQTIDVFKNKFNRFSYDGEGSPIYQFVYPKYKNCLPLFSGLPNQAQANQNLNIIIFGQGTPSVCNPVVTLDMVSHEFTHLVTKNNGHGGLTYQGESGALNESFSDIFACYVEHIVRGIDANWTIGEGLFVNYPFARSMSEPNIGYDYQIGLMHSANTYQGKYWVDTSDVSSGNDYGGVHYNCGVQNKWFYLLSEGGSGTNDNGDTYSVTGIGINDAAKIAYRNLTVHLNPDATFADSREGALESAKELFGKDSQQYKSVASAWYAVGVGSEIPTSASEEDDDETPSVCKQLIDGQIIIFKGGKKFNLQGVEIK